MKKYDIIIIGAGSAGYVAAVEAGRLGKSVLVIDKDNIGGTCLNYGCIPTKVFYQLSSLSDNLRKFQTKNILDYNLNFHFDKVIAYKNSVVLKLQKGIEYLFKKYNVEFIKGEAAINDDFTITVDDKKILTDNIIVATGSSSFMIDEWKGLAITPEEFLNLDTLPDSVLIIGGGVIGCEFAYILANLGKRVAMVEKEKNLLPSLDNDISLPVLKNLSDNSNIEIYLDCYVENIEKNGDKYISQLSNGKKVSSAKVVSAMGRKPNSSILKDKADIDKNGFIKTDRNLMSSIKNIYAIGDVINKEKMYAHQASFQAYKVVNYIFNKYPIDNFYSPYGIFVSPQVAGVGLSEREANEQNIDYEVLKYSSIGTSAGKIKDDRSGFIKVLKNKKSDDIIGIHIVSNNATEMIGTASLLFSNRNIKNSIDVLKNTIFVHPTESEIMRELFF